ncbi:phospholipid scramblase-related protein [Elusimicrobiota bacterium]
MKEQKKDLTSGALEALGIKKIFISQKKEIGEVLLNWEYANRYEILDEDGGMLGAIEEEKKSLAHAVFIRSWGRCRNYNITFYDNSHRHLMSIMRGFTFFGMSKVQVNDASGRPIGYIKRVFPPLIKRIYGVFDGKDHRLGLIKGSLFHPWTFKIYDMNEIDSGMICKKWSGALREVFTDADNFMLDTEGSTAGDTFKKIMLAAVIVIDFDFFESTANK